MYCIKKDTVYIFFFELGINGMPEFYLMKIMCNFSNAFYYFLQNIVGCVSNLRIPGHSLQLSQIPEKTL